VGCLKNRGEIFGGIATSVNPIRFPALISALSDFPALFASLTRENPHEEIEGKIELRKIPTLFQVIHLVGINNQD